MQSEKGQLKYPLMRFNMEGHVTPCHPSVFMCSGPKITEFVGALLANIF